MKLLLFFVISCLFIHFCCKYVPKTLTNNKKLIYRVTAGLFLCSLFGGQLVEGALRGGELSCPKGQSPIIINPTDFPGMTTREVYAHDIHSVKCVICPAGHSGTISDECTPCKSGTYSPKPGSEKCTPCPAKTYSDAPGSTGCKNCQPGHGPNEKRTDCEACTGNKVSEGGEKCFHCGVGYVPNTGKTECVPCSDGQILNEDNTECIDCPPGQGSNVNKTECISCTEGKFSSLVHRPWNPQFNDGCYKCGGPFVPNTEKTDCVACSDDKGPNEGVCEICPTVPGGARRPWDGDDVQMIPDKSGSWPPSKCVCPPGHINPNDAMGNDLPTDDPGFYCMACPPDQIPDDTGHNCGTSCDQYKNAQIGIENARREGLCI